MSILAHDSSNFYRPDIDGLRAIAVLAVVLFHIDEAWVPGGFAGVDIFFVISGFLITRNILKDAASPQGFSWKEFYRRRILRILQVLFLVLGVTLLVGHFLLLPDDLLELSYSALASVFSLANVYFTYFLDTSYFADDSSLQPLLHLWSLGVEEQFYVFWPIFLVALFRRAATKWLVGITFALVSSSFLLAELLLVSAPMFAYYMLPTRAGELLIGALLAIYLATGGRVFSDGARILKGILGAAMIAFGLIWVTEDMGFPGVNALPATVGAALLIWAGAGKVIGVNGILGLRPLALIGLISYSLYLWHWPVLAFYRYLYGNVEPVVGILLLGLMLLFSVLSYRWIEKPCRQLRWSFKQVTSRLFGLAGGTLAALCLAIVASKGFGLYQFDDEYRSALKSFEPAPVAYSYPYVCQRPHLTEKELSTPACIINSSDEPSVLLWGDSNASHYVGMLGAFAESAGFSFRNAAHSACPPLLIGAAEFLKPGRLENCRNSIATVERHLGSYSTVILGAAWAPYVDRNKKFIVYLEETLDLLVKQGKTVIILGQVPMFKFINSKCPQKALKVSALNCVGGDQERSPSARRVNVALKRLAESRENVYFFEVTDFLCPNGQCRAFYNGALLYFDESHLSMEGAWLLGRSIVRSTGIPSVFSLLGDNHPRPSQQPLDAALLNRGKDKFARTNLDWSTLISEQGSRWRGTAVLEKEGAAVRWEDDSESEFAVMRYRFMQYELDRLNNKNEGFMLRVDFSSCSGATPMLRVVIRSAGEEVKHDVVLDCASRKWKVKGSLEFNDVNVGGVDGKPELKIFYRSRSKVEAVDVSLYPAVGNVLGRYTTEAMGMVRIKDIAWVNGDE